MKYNLSKIMLKAWKIYRKTKDIRFAEALHRAWLSAKAEEINAKRIENAKQAAGIAEETNTFAKWKELGYKVIMVPRHYSDVLLSGEAGETAQNTRQVSLESLR